MKGKSNMGSSSRRNAGSGTPSPSKQSHHSGSRKSGRKSGLATSAIFGEDDEDLSDLDDAEDALFNSRPIRSNASRTGARSTSRSGSNAPTSSNNIHSPKRKTERKKEERKASVRKETYDLDGTDSELSDAPEENSSNAKDARSHQESDDPNLTDSDDDMAERLRAAGDGESLLGSAISDREGGDTDQEEERFIIEDARRLQAKADARRQWDGSTPQRAEKSVSPSTQKRRAQQDDDPFPDNASGSLSPQTLQQLGLDELFGEADGFHSSSEPSFTDFFMSDSEDGTDDDDIELEARSDDDQLTTDDDDDESDISDMEDGLLSAPFLSEALAAGAGTQLMPHNPDAIAQADIPLLVIEDLDGRLIYARAGDGEAVFGSDGEFEFVDDSEEESDEDDIHFPMDGFNGTRWTNWRNDDGDETDEGETTDELPNEDMPFPRLLVGSVAPRGGRNARRARALAARSRRISPARARGHSREISATKDVIENIEQNANINETVKEQSVAEAGNGNSATLQDVDFSISTEDLARDPQATLEAAAKSLGLTVDEVAQLVIGSAASTSNNADGNVQASGIPNAAYLSPEMNNVPLPIPVTPDQQRYQAFRRAPLMGSFMPTSSKGIHRAVIDGSSQAPSPFSNRFGTQRKGLANGKKRQPSQSMSSAKRLRRESAASMALNSEYSENHETQPEEDMHEDIDEMDLDDVMDASMMWRGSYSSSPPHGSLEEKAGSLGKKSPAMRPSSARKASNAGASATSLEKSTGLNLNAVARWHRIPMGAFRDGQVTASHAGSSSNVMANQQQPLGSFLLTRARGGGQHGGKNGASSRAQAEHSPFRGRTRGDSIHLGQAPKMTTMRDAFIVSPVLWPSNSNGQAVPNVQLGGHHQVNQLVQGQNGANDTRKMTTRREKRERKARRAALKSALESAATEDVPDSSSQSPSTQVTNAGSALLDSPSTALPRLSITDASPHGSPLASKSKLLPPSGLSKEITGEKVSEFAVPDIAASGKNKASGAIDIPSSSAFSSSPSLTGMTHGSQAGVTNTMSGSMPTTSPSSSLSSQHQPPSSVFGMPLHSPLFGSILNPTNLGFRDDLDERDEEGILTI
ncbi:uncharacterized protein FA14DRAFT_179134 [Meira miltonrushii]|uniref:Uncharacterized protein n=1 Tax=Meira miltonrushii TaxID=1280837 RepID=A0A316VDK8_9BASI|nr:uncharacterized protein FA14DRAFT_179134 [Meira miltonrushii]PWN35767.1 hypothetical protein FA14DRAFT_179134 [Meira miltonrushii]